MKRNPLRPICLMATLACIPALAAAEDGQGFRDYMGLEGGLNLLKDQSLSGSGLNADSLGFKKGYVGGLVLGTRFANHLRPELEFAYRSNKLSSANFTGGGGLLGGLLGGGNTSVSGKEDALTGMLNLWYDFDFGFVHPYIGAGAGGAVLDVRNVTLGSTNWSNDSTMVLAYQGGAGVAFDVSKAVQLSVDYRYLRTQPGSFDIDHSGGTARLRYTAQNAMVGLRFLFGTPPETPAAPTPAPEVVPVVEAPAPAPAPPPPCQAPAEGQPLTLDGCKPGDSIVLRGVNFETAKATLTANAKTLLDEVATALDAHKDIKVEIDGYTDSQGAVAYNKKLSQKRADAVEKYLAEHGIDASRMSAQGFGMDSPVADNTTDEGRELNRRVELKVMETAPAAAEPAAPAALEEGTAAPADAVAPAETTEAMPAAPAEAPAMPAAAATDAAPAASEPPPAAEAPAAPTGAPAPSSDAAPAEAPMPSSDAAPAASDAAPAPAAEPASQ